MSQGYPTFGTTAAMSTAARSVASGLDAVHASFTSQQQCRPLIFNTVDLILPTNGFYFNWRDVYAPGNHLQPESRVVVGDVKRLNDGLFADKKYTNMLKTQGAAEALVAAGVTAPTMAVSKTSGLASVNTMVGDGSGATPFMWYDTLSLDKQVPLGAAATTITTTARFPETIGGGGDVGFVLGALPGNSGLFTGGAGAGNGALLENAAASAFSAAWGSTPYAQVASGGNAFAPYALSSTPSAAATTCPPGFTYQGPVFGCVNPATGAAVSPGAPISSSNVVVPAWGGWAPHAGVSAGLAGLAAVTSSASKVMPLTSRGHAF